MKHGSNSANNPGVFPVAPGVWGMKDVFVNFYMIQNLGNETWVLVDAGLKWSAGKIKKMAAYLFGADSRPQAIILTHGHFDHTGAIQSLSEEWDVPVYVHFMEIPYVTGKSSYPPPDPTVGGGIMAYMSSIYPKSPINIWSKVNVLPADGTVPGLEGWKYLHTPGHTPGHVSLYRASDHVLIAGDAFVTTQAESGVAVMMQKKKVSGPPKYFTCDWQAAEQSVKTLHALEPKIVATGHGQPMFGAELRQQLNSLAQNFATEAVPEKGRYVNEPATADSNGILYIPTAAGHSNDLVYKVVGFAVSLIAFAYLYSNKKKKNRRLRNEYLLDFEYNF